VTGAAWRAKHPALADALVCDGLLPWTAAFLPAGADLGAVLARFHAGGVDHVSLTAAAGTDDAATALARLGVLRRGVAALPWARLAADACAIRAAKAEGALSVAFHFQTATPFAASLDLVPAFRAAGVDRAILAYNEANLFADGCHEPRNAGLSALGRRLVLAMDEAGMRVDLSHCGERTSLDVLDMALCRPAIFSHSNARALFDHERNITDAQIRACAARGGYVGLNGVGFFLGADGPEIPRRLAEHAAHIAGLAGPDRIGLGLDFMFLEGSDYGFFHAARGRWPRGYPDPPWHFLQPEQVGDLVEALLAVGFSAAETLGVLGENYLRLAL
jgi:membrane dipeptidase